MSALCNTNFLFSSTAVRNATISSPIILSFLSTLLLNGTKLQHLFYSSDVPCINTAQLHCPTGSTRAVSGHAIGGEGCRHFLKRREPKTCVLLNHRGEVSCLSSRRHSQSFICHLIARCSSVGGHGRVRH